MAVPRAGCKNLWMELNLTHHSLHKHPGLKKESEFHRRKLLQLIKASVKDRGRDSNLVWLYASSPDGGIKMLYTDLLASDDHHFSMFKIFHFT